jgi:hypothetical protein
MIAGTKSNLGAEQHKTCPEVPVSVDTPGEIHTFIRVSVAVFKPVCTLVHVQLAYIGARLRAS